uniref:Uncharacterized protein n=3 Tax=Lygus hesperus TaxID=30085 RepID=A0A0A9WBE5_LYGHE
MRGLLPHTSNRQFHVWDLQSFTKINVVEVPEVEPRISIQNILFFSLPNHVIGLYLTVFDHSTFLQYQRVCCYNLENMRYSSAVISCPLYAEGPGERYEAYYHDKSGRNVIGGREPVVLFTETMVILSESGQTYLSLFDLAEGRLLAQVEKTILEMDYNNYLSYTPCRTLKVFGNHLVFGGEIYFSKFPFVTVYNLSELQEVERFAVEGSVILSLHIHMDDLMIIGTGRKGWVGKRKLWSGEQGCMYIRDMKTKNFLCKLPYIEFIPPNPFSNQMLVRDTRDGVWDLLNFW